MKNKKGSNACSRCDRPRDNPKQRYCRACKAEYSKSKGYIRYSVLNPIQKAKAKARSYANVYLRRGKIQKNPCACGNTIVEMHHADYAKPLDISWECRTCHMENNHYKTT